MLLRWAAAAGCWMLAALAAADPCCGLAWAPDVRRVLAPSGLARIAALERAHSIHPRHSAVSLELALELERTGESARAREILEATAALDRTYLPAWTLANFYFRAGDQGRFWPWAARAAALCFDDFRPLLRLADRWAPEPSTLLAQFGERPELLRAYLDFLIGEGRWDHAQQVAHRLRERGEPADQARLDDLARRLAQQH